MHTDAKLVSAMRHVTGQYVFQCNIRKAEISLGNLEQHWYLTVHNFSLQTCLIFISSDTGFRSCPSSPNGHNSWHQPFCYLVNITVWLWTNLIPRCFFVGGFAKPVTRSSQLVSNLLYLSDTEGPVRRNFTQSPGQNVEWLPNWIIVKHCINQG